MPSQTPPPTFFTLTGIFAHRYDPCVVQTFDTISTIVSIDSSGLLPDPFNNRFESTTGKWFSYQQMQEYDRQIAVFQKVYTYNSNQSFQQTATNPAKSYTFINYKELADYNAGIAIINKLYNVKPGHFLQDIFYLPFPPFNQFPNPP